MAKKFNDVFRESKETVYSNVATALVVLASMNTAVEFTPVLAPNGAAGTTSLYTVQRRKRPVVKAVANPNTGTTSDALAVLDGFGKVEWDSMDVVTGALKAVGFKKTFNDDYDFSLNPMHAKDLKYQVGEVAVSRKDSLIALMETFTDTAAALPAFADGKAAIWDAITDEVIKLAQIDDAFKTKQSGSEFVIVMNPFTARDVAKEMGTVFNQEAPIAMTGFKTGKSINGTPVIVDETLVAGKVYIMHREALGFKSAPVEKNINVDLGITAFTGTAFYDIQTIVDASRVIKFKI